MGEETQQERAERRQKESKKSELEYELSRDLKLKKDAREMEEIEQQYRNKYADMAILFVSTLIISYLLLFLLRWIFMFLFGQGLAWFGISVAFINPFLHAAAWIAAIVSVYRGRSVLDDMYNRFV